MSTKAQRDKLERICRFRDAAVNDNWSIEQTYNTESQDRAAKLRRDGFTMNIVTRDGRRDNVNWVESAIHIWGPDDLVINPPINYDWGAIQKGLRTCNNCGKTNVETVRYSFAGRCCRACRPEMKRIHEQPGWTS